MQLFSIRSHIFEHLQVSEWHKNPTEKQKYGYFWTLFYSELKCNLIFKTSRAVISNIESFQFAFISRFQIFGALR